MKKQTFASMKGILIWMSVLSPALCQAQATTLLEQNGVKVSYEAAMVEEDKKNTYVVLANTEDMAMIAPVDLNHRIITPEFQFIEVKSDLENKIKFKYKHTGKLTVEN